MTYTYRKDGLLKRVDYPNNTFGEYAFDEAGRVTGILWKKANGDTIFSSNYVLNPTGLPIQEERQSAIHPDSIQVEEMELNYTFDQSNNEILTFGNDAVQHDDNGNVIQIGNEQYVWDEYNRLVENPDYYYEYDGLGNRKQKTNKSTGEITRYILDTNADMSWVLAEANSSNQIQYHYIYGNGLNARIDATGNTSYYHYDLRGNIIAITNQAGEITHKYEYSPYGRVIYKKEADFNPFRFVGQYGVEYENEDLYFMRARYYKPLMGRFLNVDPIYNPENLFVYADNNPLKNIDPQGTEPFSSILNFYIILRDYSKDNPPGSNSLTTGDALFMLTDFVNETRSLGMGFVDVSKILVGNNKMTMSSYYFKGAGNFSSGTKLTGAGKGNVFVSIAMGTWERGRKMHKKIKNDEFDFIDIPKMIGATALDGLIGLFPAASVASSFIEAKYHKKPSDAIFDFAEEFGESLGSDLYDLFH